MQSRGKETLTAFLAQIQALFFQWKDGAINPLRVRRPGSSPGSTTNLAFDRGQVLALFRPMFSSANHGA